MFRITEDPSSGSLVQCLAKNYKNDSIVSVDMDKVAVMAVYCDLVCVCSSLYRVPSYAVKYTHIHTTGQNMMDLVHVNRQDRIILVIFSQSLYKAP